MRSVALRSVLLRHADVIIALVVVMAYWPLASFQQALANGDTINCWLPWRWFIATDLQDGSLPWWNPLQQMGYPMHADLQGPAWYVEAIALGGTVGMGPAVLQLLFLAYVILAGWGMRRLTLHLTGHAEGALLVGVAYALSGFFTAHTMHFYAIISGAWLPWAFWALLRALDSPGWRNTALVAVFFHLLLTGGNHTFLLIAAYPLSALVVHGLWSAWRKGGAARLRPILLHGAIAAALIVITSAGTLHAVFEVGDHVERLGGLSLAQAEQNPMTTIGVASVLLPAAATASGEVLGTDPTMANAFFGALALLLVMIALPTVRDARSIILLTTVVVCGLAAMGPATPVHGLLWRLVPGMDLFRFPSYFWYFVPLGSLPLAAKGLQQLDEVRYRRWMLGTVMVALLSVIMLAGYLIAGTPSEHLFTNAFAFPLASWPTRVVVNTAFLVLILGMVALVLSRNMDRTLLVLIIAVEGIVSIHFTSWYTSMQTVPPSALQARLDLQPRGPVFPALHPMGMNRDGAQAIHPFWLNTRNFQNGPSHDGFNSFWLKGHQALTRDHALLHASMLERPWISLSDDVRTIPLVGLPAHDTITDRQVVWISEGPVLRPELALGRSPSLELLDFDHHGFRARTTAEGGSFLLIQQNHYPGWSIAVDGAAVPVVRANVAAFGGFLPAGEHVVDVRYDRPGLRWMLLVGHGVLFLLLFALAWASPARGAWTLATLVLVGMWFWSVLGHRPKADRLAEQWPLVKAAMARWPHAPTVVNTDRPLPDGEDAVTYRVDAPDEVLSLEEHLGWPLPDTLKCAWYGLPISLSMRAMLQDRYAAPLERAGGHDAGSWLLVRGTGQVPAELHSEPMEQVLVSPEHPYTPAFRTLVSALKGAGDDQLIIDLHYRCAAGAEPRLVMERKLGDDTVGYEAVSLPTPPVDGVFHAAYIVRPVAIFPETEEELGIYLWNGSSDTLWVKDIRVRLGKVME